MATVYINLIIKSIIGSVRSNPLVDPEVQLTTEGGAFLLTEGELQIIKE